MRTLATPSTPYPLNPASRRIGAKSNVSVPLPLKLIVIAALLPDEMSFRLAGLLLSPARLVLLVLTPVVLMRMGRLMATGRYHFVLSDLFVLLTGFWMFYALMQTEPMPQALINAGPLALEYCIGYFVTRSLISDGTQALSFINFLCCGIAFVGLLGLLDTISHRFLVHELMQMLVGGPIFLEAGERLGLLRATSTLDHPILFGATSSFGLLLAASAPIRRKAFAIVSCSIGLLIALSSAPIQGTIMGFGLLAYNRLLVGIRFRWSGLMTITIIGITIVFAVMDNPLGYVFNHLVFDVESAYYRIYIWQMATAAISDSPWFGISFIFPSSYEIPSTVDSLWLVWALQFGIPGAVLLLLSMVGAASLPTNGRGIHLTPAESKLGTILGIIIFLFVFLGLTVHFFGTAWILIPLLVGVRARLGEIGRVTGRL
jgi:O-Antigen ligase